jgi:hypothetical protein
MKTSRRRGRALFSLPVLALTLAACGGSDGSTQSQVASLPGTAAASASSTMSAATDPFGSGWTFSGTVTAPEDAANKIEQDCQVEAFSR